MTCYRGDQRQVHVARLSRDQLVPCYDSSINWKSLPQTGTFRAPVEVSELKTEPQYLECKYPVVEQELEPAILVINSKDSFVNEINKQHVQGAWLSKYYARLLNILKEIFGCKTRVRINIYPTKLPNKPLVLGWSTLKGKTSHHKVNAWSNTQLNFRIIFQEQILQLFRDEGKFFPFSLAHPENAQEMNILTMTQIALIVNESM